MKDTYSFTTAGLERIALAGLPACGVWSALRSQRRLLRHLSDSSAAVFAVADTGEHVVVAVVESVDVDNDWDIIGARLMDGDEIKSFCEITGRQS